MIVSPKRILWPTDFSDIALHAGKYAHGFADVFGAELHIVHVVGPLISPDVSVILPTEVPIAVSEQDLLSAAREGLDKLVAEEFDGDERIVREVLTGDPWRAICRYAHEKNIDLIVVSTHGHTGLVHVLLGSTAERIVQHAPCPVLTVKHPERDFVLD